MHNRQRKGKKTKMPFDVEIILLDLYSIKLKTTDIFINESINKTLGHIHAMKYYIAVKNKLIWIDKTKGNK